MSDSETGWTKTYPSLAYGSWFWLRHTPDAKPELHQLTGGRNWMESFGIVRDTTEFLGPVTPSDAEQLSELRRTAEQFVNAYQDKEHQLGNGQALRSFLRFRELLNPKPGKETQEK